MTETTSSTLSTLNEDQQDALDNLLTWLNSSDELKPVALLQGGPGTGKTYLLQELLRLYKYRAIVTAPTNKATKVLRQLLTTDSYKPTAMTTFSMLGLSLSANGEVKEILAPEEDINLSRYSLIIIDEASMVSTTLLEHISTAIEDQRIKVLFVGDNYQLPPVKEARSPVWLYMAKLEEQGLEPLNIHLTRVMRHQGEILQAVQQVRSAIDSPLLFRLPFLKDASHRVDLNVVNLAEFTRLITNEAQVLDNFTSPGRIKIIAWRNTTVDSYNKLVRLMLFPDTDEHWNIGDRVTVIAPAKSAEGKLIASVDEEGTIQRVEKDLWIADLPIKVDAIQVVTDENKTVVFNVVSNSCLMEYEKLKAEKLMAAKSNGRYWKNYWAFIESFHYIRHAYAITAHRAQGSTYGTVYVHLTDILKNFEKREALQCLNVAMSRASKKLIIGK